MAIRRFAWLVCGAIAICAAAAHGQPEQVGQFGPPVGGTRSNNAMDITVSSPGALERVRPAEADIPLMASPSRDEATPEPSAAVSGGWVRSLASVALVVGLILVLAAAARFLSRRSGSVAAMMGPGGRAPSGVIEVLARYPVGRGQVLVLLRIDRRVLLLSQNVSAKGGGFTTLSQFDEPSEVAAILRQTRDEASESVSARFRQAMERFQGADAGLDRGEIIEVGPRGEVLPKGRGVWA